MRAGGSGRADGARGQGGRGVPDDQPQTTGKVLRAQTAAAAAALVVVVVVVVVGGCAARRPDRRQAPAAARRVEQLPRRWLRPGSGFWSELGPACGRPARPLAARVPRSSFRPSAGAASLAQGGWPEPWPGRRA